ncbi:MAG: ABC transporter ATP-binding protein [Halodesulfurarchaeum sp.]|nr:ABC transporter ATP-binding protein [Halodesulfurarchaeum sp.]
MTLHVDDATFGYDGSAVLEDVSLAVERGELVALLGPNGSGKSTLLKVIDQIHGTSAGTVRVDGEDLDALSREEIARRIGYLPQSQSAVPSATVFDTVLLGRQPYFDWRPGESDRVAVERILEELAIDDLAMREVPTLSGGQQRLVLLARALVQAQDALLLDEPTSGLDLKHQHEVMRRVRNAVRHSNLAGVVAIHDIDLATRFCDRFAFLRGGELIAVGGEDVLTENVVERVYDVPVEVFERNGRTHVVQKDPGERTVEMSATGGHNPASDEVTAIADGNGRNSRTD